MIMAGRVGFLAYFFNYDSLRPGRGPTMTEPIILRKATSLLHWFTSRT